MTVLWERKCARCGKKLMVPTGAPLEVYCSSCIQKMRAAELHRLEKAQRRLSLAQGIKSLIRGS